MSGRLFDSHNAIEKLMAAGFSQVQAEAQVEVMQDLLERHLARKADSAQREEHRKQLLTPNASPMPMTVQEQSDRLSRDTLEAFLHDGRPRRVLCQTAKTHQGAPVWVSTTLSGSNLWGFMRLIHIGNAGLLIQEQLPYFAVIQPWRMAKYHLVSNPGPRFPIFLGLADDPNQNADTLLNTLALLACCHSTSVEALSQILAQRTLYYAPAGVFSDHFNAPPDTDWYAGWYPEGIKTEQHGPCNKMIPFVVTPQNKRPLTVIDWGDIGVFEQQPDDWTASLYGTAVRHGGGHIPPYRSGRVSHHLAKRLIMAGQLLFKDQPEFYDASEVSDKPD